MNCIVSPCFIFLLAESPISATTNSEDSESMFHHVSPKIKDPEWMGVSLQEIAGDVQVGMASMQTYNPLATNADWIRLPDGSL